MSKEMGRLGKGVASNLLSLPNKTSVKKPLGLELQLQGKLHHSRIVDRTVH